MKRVVVAGTGQLTVVEIINNDISGDLRLAGFIDDNLQNTKRNLLGHDFLGDFGWIRDHNEDLLVVNSIARTCKVRKQSTERLLDLGATFTNAIHKSASIDKSAKIGNGNIIGRNVIIESEVKIGDHNIILSNCVIAHNSVIGSYNFIGISTVIQGYCVVRDLSFLSAGVIQEPNSVISDRCVIGAGVVVDGKIESGMMALLRPGKIIRVPSFSKHYFDK